MQKRRLGRTNLEVSIVGFGGTWLSALEPSVAVDVVRCAFGFGINYFDTARWDGDSEEKLGYALSGVRDKCVIATKTGSRTRMESLVDLKRSFGLLQTDYVDIIQLHGIDDERSLSKAMNSDGALQTCKKAQKEHLARFIGITGHKPKVLVKAIESGEFDVVLVPLNVVTRQAEEELLSVAKDLDVGVVAMKVFSAKTSDLVTCMYQPSLSLISDEPELKTLLGQDDVEMAGSLLRYVLSRDVASAVVGLRSLVEVEISAKVGVAFDGLTGLEPWLLDFDFGDCFCRDCGVCMPCPENVNVPAVLRFGYFYSVFGLKNWARKLYGGLDVKFDKCSDCGLCESRCLFGLSVVHLLREAHKCLSAF